MKNFKIKRGILALFMLPFLAAQAQEQSLYFINDIWQSNLVNPSFRVEKKGNDSLPGRSMVSMCGPSLFFNLNSPLSLNDFILEQNGKKVLSLGSSSWVDKLSNYNSFLIDVNTQTLALAVPIGKNISINIGHAINSRTGVDFTQDLGALLVNGNAPYAGKIMDFSIGIKQTTYSDFGVGISYKVNKFLTFGARYKKLNGLLGIYTEGSKLNLLTDPNSYQLSFNSDYKIHTFTQIREGLSRKIINRNNGSSYDLGVTLNFGKLQVSASVLDLGGAINWAGGDTYEIMANNVQYKGISALDNFGSNAFSVDTLSNKFGFKEINKTASYKQLLPTRIYLAGTYQLTSSVQLGALLLTEMVGTNSTLHAKLDATYRFAKIFNVGANVGLRNKSFNNIGFHATVKLAVFQLYFISDNLLGAFNYAGSKDFNLRLGANIVF
jgi:hypothetical protein